MLRSLGIPTKLTIGYSASVRHAWVDVYIESEGWIEHAVEFNGNEWRYMDPTFASTGSDDPAILEYIGTAKTILYSTFVKKGEGHEKTVKPSGTILFLRTARHDTPRRNLVLEGILILKEDAPGGEGTEILTDIQESLETKGILWEALKDSGVFPEYAVHMTEVGERCGTLEEVFSSLSSYYEKEEALIKESGILFPIPPLCLPCCAGSGGSCSKSYAVFNQVFQDLGTEMTGLPEAVLILGTVLGRYAAVFVCLLLAAILFLLFLCRTSRGKRLRARLLLLFPWARRISEEISRSNFAGGLSIAIKSGLDMEECLQLVASLTDNPDFSKKTQSAQTFLSQGQEWQKL